MLLALLFLFTQIQTGDPYGFNLTTTTSNPLVGSGYNQTIGSATVPLSFSFQIPIPQGCTATTTATLVTITCTTTPPPPPPPPLTITTPVILPGATVGVPYSANLAALAKPQGGVAPYTYTATGLPVGLTISSTGTISGTPTVAGLCTVSFTVTDSSGASQNAKITLTAATRGLAAWVIQ